MDGGHARALRYRRRSRTTRLGTGFPARCPGSARRAGRTQGRCRSPGTARGRGGNGAGRRRARRCRAPRRPAARARARPPCGSASAPPPVSAKRCGRCRTRRARATPARSCPSRSLAPRLELIHLALQSAHLLPHAGDHFSHEPEAEQRHERDHKHHDQIEQRPEPDPEHVALDQRDHAHEEAEEEQDRARHAEEQHRLAPEPQLEPHGQEVEHPHGDAADPELRLPRPPGVQRDGPLLEAEALRRRDHDHEAVPVRARGERVHDLAPVGFHRVEIGDPDAEQPAAQRVVDPGNEALLVVSLLRPRHDVRRSRQDRRHEAGDVGRAVLQVRGIEHQDVPPRRLGAGPERVRDATLAAVRHDPDERMLGRELLQRVRRPVAAAVVDHHHLDGVWQRQQRLTRLAHELGEVLGLVLGGHEDAPLGRHGGCGEAHRRFRMRAGRMLNWSRYLATVRRAILTPFCSNSSTICWSVSGFFGSSSATIFSICALILRALASSPVVVESPLEKKNLSGSSPRGVCTYFSFVTRLTVLSCMLITSATSRSVSGFKYSTPFSKKSRWRSTMKFITLSMVWRRCSIAWIIQCALFMRWLMKSLFSPWNFFLSRAMSWYVFEIRRRGKPASFKNTLYCPSIFSTTRSGMMYASLAAECCRPGLGSSLARSSATFCTSVASSPKRLPRSLQRCALRSSKASRTSR